MNRNIKRYRCILFLVIAIVGFSCILSAYELYSLPKATYTEKGVPRAKLKIIKEFSPDFDEKLFFAQPRAITVGNNQQFYVYDRKLMKVFIFDGKFSCLGQFLDRGVGPGEVRQAHNIKIHFGLDGNFYLADGVGDKVIRFSPAGKYLNDYRMNRAHSTTLPYPPVVDKEGFLYTYSINGGIVDKFDLEKKQVVHTYLDVKLNNHHVIYKGELETPASKYLRTDPFQLPNYFNTSYDIMSNGHLLIFLHQSATAFIFNGKRQEHQFSILIDSVLVEYKKNVEKMIEEKKIRGKQETDSGYSMFFSCFVDQDEPYFYLEEISSRQLVYQFKNDGKLVRILTEVRNNDGSAILIQAKKNGMFYGVSMPEGNPVVLKMEEK